MRDPVSDVKHWCYIISSQNICQSYLIKSACCFTGSRLAELIESYEILNNIFSRGDAPEKKLLKPCKNVPVNTRKG